MNLLKVTNKLGLNESANEDSILSAITAIENKADKSEKDKKDLQEKCDKLEKDLKAKKDEYDAMKGEFDKAKNDLEEMDRKNKEKEAADKKEKAKNLVQGFLKAGKIKADAVNKWQAKAEADFDGTKDLLESIPGNQKAVHFETKETGQGGTGGVYAKEIEGGVAFDMAKIANKLEKRN